MAEAEACSMDNKPAEDGKPKPCCVCKPEKEARDQCLLFNGTEAAGTEKCKEFIEKYKACMKGYGFEI
ncbi:copper metallochaperone [Maudiozyma humilis]|uniref:Copper metallochaperone n=1 Tax=Maudiozyma humilis TaxID=51915 RepID=A0AAV5RY11_MAUHU|nr:copper metallochaperone [Kazachstania humilis]